MPDIVVAAIARVADDAEFTRLLNQCAGLEAARTTRFTKRPAAKSAPQMQNTVLPFRAASSSSSSDGTAVPGMRRVSYIGTYASVAPAVNHLAGVGISADAAYYYNLAIDEGRGVVTYVTTPDNAASVEEQFRSCGFVKIRHFARE